MDKGAHYHRCDFQVHSPRDRNWTGKDCVSESDRQAYAISLIQACRSKGLDAIAVTDHHDLLFARYIRQAARQEKDSAGKPVPPESQITVFPGIELTLAVPCQALLIFDADFPDDMFSLVLTALAISPSAATQAKTVETKRLEHITTIVMLKEELDKHEYLRNRYIILPNVSDGGHDTLLRKGNGSKYAQMPCFGGYLDGSVAQLGDGNRNIIEGRAGEYGNKRIALFQTSDNRKADHGDLCKHTTWVKWSVPTAEALRQACLAQESRISQTIPELPAVVITSLDVSNSVFLGRILLEFNDQYNALIGGRGTGKSTILEYLRWALCDQLPSLTAEDELPNYQLRRRALIDKTLQTVNATVQVGFTVNGIPHLVRRNSKTGEILLKVGSKDFEACTEADIRTLLPIQAYSQKQLSNVSVRLEELSRFVEAPIRGELDDIEKQFERTSAEIRQVYATLSRARRLRRQIENDELLLKSLVEQTASIRGTLKGLGEDDIKLLEAKTQYDKAAEALVTWSSDVEQASDAIDEMEETFNSLPTDVEVKLAALPEAAVLEEIEKATHAFIAKTKSALSQMKKERDAIYSPEKGIQGEVAKGVAKWQKALSTFNDKYEQAKGRATAHQTQLTQLQQLEKRINELRTTIAASKRETTGLGNPEKRYSEVREAWLLAKRKRSELVERECEALTKRSNGEIRARVRIGAGVEEVLNRLRSAVTGSGLRANKFEALSESIEKAEKPDELWTNILGDLELLSAYIPEEKGGKNIPWCKALSACGFADADLMKIASKLNEDTWLELSLLRLEDRPIFEHRKREGDYIPFTNASAGQQATALLKALLNQPGPPLIIDQPEEDLDNPVILEVVNQIWQSKKVRQLILASHNANLVVNGDAELVVWCDYRAAGDQSGGEIRGSGAIDMPTICGAIKQVMEGGETAFKLRKDKYGF